MQFLVIVVDKGGFVYCKSLDPLSVAKATNTDHCLSLNTHSGSSISMKFEIKCGPNQQGSKASLEDLPSDTVDDGRCGADEADYPISLCEAFGLGKLKISEWQTVMFKCSPLVKWETNTSTVGLSILGHFLNLLKTDNADINF